MWNNNNPVVKSSYKFVLRPGCKCPPPTTSRLRFPRNGTRVPPAAEFKQKQNVKFKIERLANDNRVPSILLAIFIEIARRFLNGQSARTSLESDIFNILSGLSPEVIDVLRFTINVVNAVPSSQRDRILSPYVTAGTALTVDNVANLLVQEFLQRAGLNLLGMKMP
ncbi:hypothetical protein RDV78_05500 [Bacillota bacterium LX-D]|nr:hypothetical protein [Bacillota bacterium LX-D]